MARTRADMQRLIDQRDQLLTEIEALRNKVAGLEMAMSLLENNKKASKPGDAQRTKGVKQVILDMLQEVGTTGLNAATAVNTAERRGMALKRDTVSSLLSRLKTEGVIVYDGEKYRLPEFAAVAAAHHGQQKPELATLLGLKTQKADSE